MADFLISLNIYSFFYILGPYEHLEKSMGYTWPLIFLNYIAFRAFFALILGTSLSQYIFGLRSSGDFLWKRLGGVLRSLYEIPSVFLFPFTELPVLFGKKTVKEYLSQTSISPKNHKLSFFGIFIFLPMAFSLAVFSPFYEIFFVRTPMVSTQTYKPFQKELKPNFTYRMNGAGLHTASGLLKDRFVLIPSFKMTKWGSENDYRPQYIFYDKLLRRNLSFYFEKGPDIMPMVKLGKNLNPLFGNLYPNLDTLEFKNEGMLSKQQSEELELFLEKSLNLDSTRPFNYILNNGIFIKGPLSLKNHLLKRFPADRIEKVRMGDKNFLCFKENKNGKDIETYLPLFLKNTFVLKITHAMDSNFRNDFLSTFFYFSRWEYPNFSIPFYLSKEDLDYKKFAGEGLLSAASEALALKDPLYLDTVIDALDRYLFVTQLQKIDFDTTFKNQLISLKNELLEKTFALRGQ